MAARQTTHVALSLILTALLTVLSGCTGGQPSTSLVGVGSSTAPDHVQITIHLLQPPGGNDPEVTLTEVPRVQQLYSSVVGLPPLADNAACPTNKSLSYTLTFLRQANVVTTVNADSSGCGTVLLAGDKLLRQASQAFWSQLEEAISLVTSAAQADQLAILRRSQLDQPPQTALLASAVTVQHLYLAIRHLPPAPLNGGCTPDSSHEYLLVFHSTEETIPAVLDQTCQTISLDTGSFPSPFVTYAMTAPFQQVFEATLAEASFAPAHPDQLTVEIQVGSSATRQITVADASLRERLYTTTFALPTVSVPPDCPPYNANDNTEAENGTWYQFEFRQWDLLTLVLVDAHEGSCRLVFLDSGWGGISTGQILQADGAFWDLAHQAALA